MSSPDVQTAALELQRKSPSAFRRAMSVLKAETEDAREIEVEELDGWTLKDYAEGNLESLGLESDEVLEQLDRLENRVGYARTNETNLLSQVLQQQIAEENAAKSERRAVTAMKEWAKRNDLSPAQASEEVRAANELQLAAGGEPLGQILARDPQQGIEFLDHAVAYGNELKRVGAVTRFQENLLNETSTDVREGITENGRSTQERWPVYVPFDEARANSRARQGRRTHGDLRRAIVAPESTSVLEGLRAELPNGRTVSGEAAVEESTGSRREKERLEREARARSGQRW